MNRCPILCPRFRAWRFPSRRGWREGKCCCPVLVFVPGARLGGGFSLAANATTNERYTPNTRFLAKCALSPDFTIKDLRAISVVVGQQAAFPREGTKVSLRGKAARAAGHETTTTTPRKCPAQGRISSGPDFSLIAGMPTCVGTLQYSLCWLWPG